jgi:hypothetical protein
MSGPLTVRPDVDRSIRCRRRRSAIDVQRRWCGALGEHREMSRQRALGVTLGRFESADPRPDVLQGPSAAREPEADFGAAGPLEHPLADPRQGYAREWSAAR